MNAKKCDRCGAFYNEDDVFTAPSIREVTDSDCHETSYSRMELFWWPSNLHYGIDLCPKCGEYLYNWLSNAQCGPEEAEPVEKSVDEILNSKCCETCSHVEFRTVQSAGTIDKICTLNPARPIIGDPGHHVCRAWCYGAGIVTFVSENESEPKEPPYEDNTDKHCESCKWHIIKDVGASLLHECGMTKTQILRPDTMTCPNWEEL